MKKGLLLVLTLLIFVSISALSSCEKDDDKTFCRHTDDDSNSLCDKCGETYVAPKHTHNFNQKKTDNQYLVSEADCENAAVYYYSCSCAEKGTETFTHGASNGHRYISDTCMECGCAIVYSEGLEFLLSDDGEYYSVFGLGTCTDTDIVIPPTYNGLPVTYIYREAFEFDPENYESTLTSVAIPSTVTGIGSNAFDGRGQLKSVTIPDSVTSIENEAFYQCGSLENLTLPDNLTHIGMYAFRSCSSLTSLTIPDSVTYIGEGAFSHCSSLTSITLGNGITSIDGFTFTECFKLKDVKIGSNVTSIEGWAFHYCTSLTSITLPADLTNIGNYAFLDCRSLISIKYRGTKAQWDEITKGNYWHFNTSLTGIIYNYKDQ